MISALVRATCLGGEQEMPSQTISKEIRKILHLEKPNYYRTIRLPPRNTTGMFLEMKLKHHPLAEHSLARFKRETEDVIWEPPMTTEGFIYNYPGWSPYKAEALHPHPGCKCEITRAMSELGYHRPDYLFPH
ncbi:Sterile alpha motif [Sparganum proliferum]